MKNKPKLIPIAVIGTSLMMILFNNTYIGNAELKIDKVYEDETLVELEVNSTNKSGHIVLPSGNKVSRNSINYISTANGTYTFSDHTINNTVSERSFSISNLRSNSLITATPNVKLNLSSTDTLSGVESMRFKNEVNGTWSVFEPYTTEKLWTLINEDGQRTVYAQFKDRAGNISDEVFDAIYLDIIPPVCTLFTINDNATYTNNENVTLTINGTDNYSTVKSMEIYNPNESAQSYNYDTTKDWVLPLGDGTKTVYLHLIDGVGNRSGAFTDTIILDQTLPFGSITVAEATQNENGDYIVPSPDVTLNLNISDALSGIKEVNIYEGSNKMTLPNVSGNNFTQNISWTLSTDTPTTFLTLEVIDNAGNVYRVDTPPLTIHSLKIVDFYLDNVFNPSVFKDSFTRLSWYGTEEGSTRPAGFPRQPMLSGGDISFSLKYDILDNVLTSYDLKWKYTITITSPSGTSQSYVSDEFTATNEEKQNKLISNTYRIPYGVEKGSTLSIQIELNAICTSKAGVNFNQEAVFPIEGGKVQIGEITGDIREQVKFNEIE